MIQRYYFFLLLVLPLCALQAQTKASMAFDSLKNLRPLPDLEILIQDLNNIESIAKEDGDKITQSQCLLFLTKFYSKLDDPINLEESLYRLLAVAKDTSIVPYSSYSSALNNASSYEKRRGNFIKAIDLLLKAINLEKSTSNSISQLIEFYHNIAVSYESLGDYLNAFKYSNKALEYALNKEVNKFLLGEEYYNIGLAYKKLEDLGNSENSFIKSLQNLDRVKLDDKVKIQKIQNYQEIADINIIQNNLTKAESNINQADRLQPAINFRQYKSTELRAKLYQAKGNISQALALNQKALTEALDYYKNTKEYIAIPRINEAIAKNFISLNQNDNAISQFNNGLEYLNLNTLRDGSILQMTEITPSALSILNEKKKLLFQMYDFKKDNKYLKQAYDLSVKSIQYLDKMKAAYLNEGSKFFIAEKATKIYQDAIEVFYQNYLISNKEESAENIFMTMEKNKAGVLLENLKYKFNVIASALPEETIKQNNDFKSKISFYKKLLGEVNQAKDIDKEKQKELEDLLFHTKEDFNIFSRKLKAEYPEYESFKSKLAQTRSIKDVQEYLGDGELLIEYLQTESKLYRLDISTDRVAVSVTDGMGVDSLIQTCSSLLNTAPDESANPDILRQAAKKLGELLLPQSTKEYTKIAVVPDGNLTTIPYESLILADDTYLIEQSLITYAYSAEQLLSGNRDTESQPKILSIAPVFEENTIAARNSTLSSLSALPYAQEEGIYLRDNFNAELISSTQTSTADLIDNMANYGIIHLATHASLNTTDPMMSEIHFNNGSITNYDIRDLQVQPDLVVLSACNTAQGNIQKGEGIISLSRGFFEAGVKSLQSSLWSINDQSSSEIVKGMYGHMKSGKSTAAALRQAKLDYINTADKKRAHPYYWAGIIQIGQDSVLFDNGIHLGYFITGGIVLFLLLYVFYKILKARQD